jgi:hypothetical protein
MRLDPPVAGGEAAGGAFAGGAGGAFAGGAVGAGGAGGAGGGGGAGDSDFPNPKSPDIEFNKLFVPLDISVLA